VLVLKVLMIAVGAQFVTTGIFDAFWGRRFRDGYPLPERMGRNIYGDRIVDRRWGRSLWIRGSLQVAFFGLLALAGLAWLLRDDRMTVGHHQARLFSASSDPQLDLVEMFVLTVITVAIWLNSKLMFSDRRVEPAPPGTWTPFPKGQSRSKGVALIAGGTVWCAAVAGLCVFLTALMMAGHTDPGFVVFMPALVFISAPAYVAGLDLRRRGRRHRARVFTSPDEIPDRPFVLYLRSFADDVQLDVAQFRPGMPILNQFLVSGRSGEEQLARAVRRLGPLVAVGEPGERLPYVGADRVYLPAGEWQPPVRDLIGRARLVVLAVGRSDGALWELAECMRVLAPERLVLLVPLERDEYRDFRSAAVKRGIPPAALPLYPPDASLGGHILHTRLKALVRYGGAGWEPTFVWLASELTRTTRMPEFRDRVYVALKHALAPTVDRLGRQRQS
jgi:hypothetical protein